jgi:predicted nuclease of predicted toxin-antitoxin system
VKILLDECIDQRFRRELNAHQVSTVQEAGWAGKKNGELLALAFGNYEVFVTVDRNLHFQQNVAKYDIAVLILSAHANRLADLKPLAASVLTALATIKSGETILIPK